MSGDESHYEELRLVFLVKSAIGNTDKRAAIRKSWGNEKRFSDVLVGQSLTNVKLQAEIEAESRLHNDIVQGDFDDT